jgi:hypothetical protein
MLGSKEPCRSFLCFLLLASFFCLLCVSVSLWFTVYFMDQNVNRTPKVIPCAQKSLSLNSTAG